MAAGEVKVIAALILVGAILVSSGCSKTDSAADVAGRAIKLWVAPNEGQEAFWKIAVERWNNSGEGTPVTFTTIPAAESSEKAILTALVSGNAPDISTNIFPGFAAQLAGLGQLADLSAIKGYRALIGARHMGRLMQAWDQDGRKYVFPLYVNPTLIWWRGDILRKLGITTIPQTFDDVYKLSAKYAAADHKYGMQVIAGNNWADRWFDFISFYYAASNGAAYIRDDKALYNNAAGLSVAKFIDTIFRNGWSALDFDSDEPLVTGLVAGAVHGPWDIAYFRKIYPDTLKKIIIGPMITDHKTRGRTHTFADTKGLVIFKSSKMKNQAFAFVSWVFTNDNLSALWLQKTGLPPARGDLMTNPVFKAFYDRHPLARKYAEYVDVAIPGAFIESTVDVQKTMGFEMVEPIKFGRKKPEVALADAVRRTDQILRVSR